MSKHVYSTPDHRIYNVCGTPYFFERQAVLFDDEDKDGEETYFINERGRIVDFGDEDVPSVFDAYEYIGKRGEEINPKVLTCAIDTPLDDSTFEDVLYQAKEYFSIQQPPELLNIEFDLRKVNGKNRFRVDVFSNWLCFGEGPIFVNLDTMNCDFKYSEELSDHRQTFAGKFIDPILWYEANYPGSFKLSINFIPELGYYTDPEEITSMIKYQDTFLPILQKYIADYSAKRRTQLAEEEREYQKYSLERRDKWLATNKDYRYVCLTRNAQPCIEGNENK